MEFEIIVLSSRVHIYIVNTIHPKYTYLLVLSHKIGVLVWYGPPYRFSFRESLQVAGMMSRTLQTGTEGGVV